MIYQSEIKLGCALGNAKDKTGNLEKRGSRKSHAMIAMRAILGKQNGPFLKESMNAYFPSDL